MRAAAQPSAAASGDPIGGASDALSDALAGERHGGIWADGPRLMGEGHTIGDGTWGCVGCWLLGCLVGGASRALQYAGEEVVDLED